MQWRNAVALFFAGGSASWGCGPEAEPEVRTPTAATSYIAPPPDPPPAYETYDPSHGTGPAPAYGSGAVAADPPLAASPPRGSLAPPGTAGCPSHVPSRPNAAVASPVPPGFALVSSPSPASLACANLSRKEWRAGSRAGAVTIEPYGKQNASDSLPFSVAGKPREGIAGARHVAEVEDGYLVGYDGGDSSRGALFWFSKDGRQRARLADENVTSLVKFGTAVVALSGDARGGQSGGRALRLEHRAAWEAVGRVDLAAAVQAGGRESDETLVAVTTSGVFRITACGDVFQLVPNTFDVLYPNSLVVDSAGVVTIGMRQYVVQLVPGPQGFGLRWLLPEGCTTLERRRFECVCL